MEAFVERVSSKEITEDATAIVEELEGKMDEKTLLYKLASIIAEDYKIKGSDIIGKSMKDIDRLIENSSRYGGKYSGGGRSRGRGGYNRNRSGGGYNRNRSGGGYNRDRGSQRDKNGFSRDGGRRKRREYKDYN
jgi:ATP-dependent RNA helicase DeaD